MQQEPLRKWQIGFVTRKVQWELFSNKNTKKTSQHACSFFLFLHCSLVSRVNPGWRLHQLERVQRGRSSSRSFPFSAWNLPLPCSSNRKRKTQLSLAPCLVYSSLARYRSALFILPCSPRVRAHTPTLMVRLGLPTDRCLPTLRASGPQRGRRRRNRLNWDRQLRNFQPSVKCRTHSLTPVTTLAADGEEVEYFGSNEKAVFAFVESTFYFELKLNSSLGFC